MLKITVACVGRVKEKYLRDGIAEYEKRLQNYCRIGFCEVSDEPTREGASPREDMAVKQKEGSRLLSVIPGDAFVIALDRKGESLDSVSFARKMEDLAVSGRSHLVFVIGGSLGLSPEVLKRADYRLSFSRMTFPHQLMRLILLEQIYRCFRIIRGEPYHK
jgi:23S rRNA (pseudouridine1915-N3)-methyltransferase